jgi:transcriptional regulator with XRE-family HTH domain
MTERSTISDPPDKHPLSGRLRALRKQRHWSLERLADASGVSRSMLSQVERGEANPTIGVTYAIARALGLSIGELLDDPGVSSLLHVVRAGDREYHYRSDPECRIRTLSPLVAGRDVELYEIRLGPGGMLRSAAHYAGTREIVTVHKGRIDVQSGEETETLAAGDSAEYRADLPHALVNRGRGEALLFLLDVYR